MPAGSTPSPLDRRPTSDVIADLLRDRIVTGALPPGSQLTEIALSQELEVSRGPIREAMQRLIQERLLVAERYRGVFVVTLTGEDVDDIYLARSAVERAAARLVVQRADTAATRRLGGLVERMRAAAEKGTSWQRLADLDMEFHQTLVGASGSRRLVQMYDTLVAETRICLATLEPEYPSWAAIVTEHENLVAALREGDADRVLEAVDEHLLQAVHRRGDANGG